MKDSTNLRRYTVMPVEKFLEGYEYTLKIPYRQFRDINGFYNDSTVMKVSLPIHNEYIVDLLTEKRDKVIRGFHISKDGTLVFPYVKAGKYCIRITEDINRNGIVDTGVLLEHKQPEKVRFFKIEDSFLIEIPEKTELEQEINLKELFR